MLLLGWVEFIKEFEDADWVVYRYSHDCTDYDVMVKIKKDKVFREDNVVIMPSKCDCLNNKFAYCVISRVFTWIRDDQPLLDNI